MTVIDRRETVEIEIATLYGEGEAHVETSDGDLRIETVRGDRHGGRGWITVAVDVPDPDHALGLASLGRAEAIDAVRSGQA